MTPGTDLQAALTALSEAHGSSALASAFQQLRRRVKAVRRADTVAHTLGSVVMDAILMRDQLKAEGLAGPALDHGLEAVLRDTWPKPANGRVEPWHDGCTNCRDYGLEMFNCPGDATCGPNPASGRPRPVHDGHECGKPCWCPHGRRHESSRKPSAEDAETMAARPKKPMTRWGR